MTLKMGSRDDRIGRSVSLGELMGLPGVMPPPANRCGGNRGERVDEGFDLSGFRNRLASGLDRGVETLVLEAPRVLKTGMPVDDALGGGVGLGKLSVIGGAHEGISNVLAHAVLRLRQRNLGIFAEDNMTMDLLTSWLLGDQTWNRAVLKDVVVVIDGLEMLDDNRPINAALRDLRNMLSPTSAILAGCFAAEGREDDETFAETHSNADALVCILHGD